MTVFAEHRQSNIWWLFLFQGLAGTILGLLLITAPGATTIAIVGFLGGLLAHHGDTGVGARFRGSLCPVGLVASNRYRRNPGGTLRD